MRRLCDPRQDTEQSPTFTGIELNTRMSKDYKNNRAKPAAPRSSSKASSGGSSILAGLLIGLCIGVAIAVAAALYLNKSGSALLGRLSLAKSTDTAAPQAAKPTAPLTPEILAPEGAKGSLPAPVNGAAVATAAAPQDERFKFYDMLPGLSDPKTPPAPAKPSAAPPPSPATPGNFLQTGAFQNETDADNLKAKLALMGVEAHIQSADIPGKGIMHRVRVGPLASADDIDRVRAQLKVNGIDSSLVRNP